MKLNLGSGKRDLEGYVNIDAVKQTSNTLVGDILNLNYEDGSVKEIFSEHVIEHLDRLELERFFSECGRLLKRGGKLKLISPCLITVLNKFINKENFVDHDDASLMTIDTLDSFLFANHTHKYDYHKQGIYKEKLERLCAAHGFEVIKIYCQSRPHSYNEIVLEAYFK